MSHKAASVLVLVSALALSSCTSVRLYNSQPDKMYEGDHPLSDTAVFSAHDELSAICPGGANVRKVDDKETSRFASPMWVRVTPGTHSFVVECTNSAGRRANKLYRKYADLEIKIPDMKPRHVYVTRYNEVAQKIEVTTDDLGENSYYSIQLGDQFITPEF